MAGKKVKPRQDKAARKDWAAFCVGWHGRGAHKDKSRYTRKTKHKGQRYER